MTTDPLQARFGKVFEAGDVLFREGDAGDVMYIIQSGAVRISRSVRGEDKTLAVLGPGEFVGELALLNARPRTGTATVVEGPMRCLTIDAQTLEAMVLKNTEIALRLIKKLAKRLESADALVEILMHRDPKARVLLALLRHADAFGERTHDGIVVRTNPSDLAAEIGADEALAEDLFTRLRRLRLLEELPSGAIVVTDLGRLHDFIEFLEGNAQSTQES